jgi:hypothetical protein
MGTKDPVTSRPSNAPPSVSARRALGEQSRGFAGAAAQRERGGYNGICWQPEPRSDRDQPTCIGVWEPHDRSAATQPFQ